MSVVFILGVPVIYCWLNFSCTLISYVCLFVALSVCLFVCLFVPYSYGHDSGLRSNIHRLHTEVGIRVIRLTQSRSGNFQGHRIKGEGHAAANRPMKILWTPQTWNHWRDLNQNVHNLCLPHLGAGQERNGRNVLVNFSCLAYRPNFWYRLLLMGRRCAVLDVRGRFKKCSRKI